MEHGETAQQKNCTEEEEGDITTTDNNNKEVKFADIEEMETEYNIDDGDGEDDDGDEEGWITPGNIKKVKEEMGVNDEMSIKDAGIQCACLTTDFAMQV